MWDVSPVYGILGLDVALEQIVDRTVEHFGHLLKFRLRDISTDHPVVNSLSGNTQRGGKFLNGHFSAASLCIDVGIKQSLKLLSCILLLELSNCNYNIPKMSNCKAEKYPNRADDFC
jgi:hypothetical protein